MHSHTDLSPKVFIVERGNEKIPKVLDTNRFGRYNNTMKPIKPIERLKDLKIERCKKLIFKSYTFLICNLLIFNLFASQAFAVDVAPRISDKEIIEKLSALEAGQKALQQQIVDTNRRIDDLKVSTQQQINDLKESNNRQFDGVNKRLDTLQWLLGLFTTVALSVMVIMGRILWNQQKKLTEIETSLKAQKEEISFLKILIEKLQTLIEKLLPPRGVL